MSFIERKPKGVVISLYDFTGEALRPWAEDGYECFAFDIQHDDQGVEYFRGGGSIKYLHADLHNHEDINAIQDKFSGEKVAFGMAFPVCTDMAVSGAAWFEKKRQANPSFQDEAVSYAMWCAKLFNSLHIPFFVENPISVLATRWRKPNYKFHPYEYGGYIPGPRPNIQGGQIIFPRRMHTRRRPVCGQAMALRCQSRGPWIQRRTTGTGIPRL